MVLNGSILLSPPPSLWDGRGKPPFLAEFLYLGCSLLACRDRRLYVLVLCLETAGFVCCGLWRVRKGVFNKTWFKALPANLARFWHYPLPTASFRELCLLFSFLYFVLLVVLGIRPRAFHMPYPWAVSSALLGAFWSQLSQCIVVSQRLGFLNEHSIFHFCPFSSTIHNFFLW